MTALLFLICFQPGITFDLDRDAVRLGPFDRDLDRSQLQLLVYVAADCEVKADALPVLGQQIWQDDYLLFLPEYGFDREVDYCARQLQAGKLTQQQHHRYAYEDGPGKTKVSAIYPTMETLPANHLRFYIAFNAPMQIGDAYDHIVLMNDTGQIVEDAFFQDRAELWDPFRKRFTLYLDPSRVKRGLRYREELGPVLHPGKTYTLLVKRSWKDGNGQPLTAAFEKTFHVGEPDYQSPNQANWVIQEPTPGSREAFEISFPKPLDYGLLQNSIWLEDKAGQEIEGTIEITDQERRWTFKPKHPWHDMPQFRVAQRLSDSCGNSLAATFEQAMD